MHDFGHWDGHGMGGHFGRWRPGHWHAASGFGNHGHWQQEGLWHLLIGRCAASVGGGFGEHFEKRQRFGDGA